MNRTRQAAVWDDNVRAAFVRRYEGSPRALAYYTELWAAHLEAGLADGELVSALIGDIECTRRQRIWEMQLAAHLRACGHVPGRRPEGQPDYRIEAGGAVVWVEAISPAPGNQVPTGWLDEPVVGQGTEVRQKYRIQSDGLFCWVEAVPPGEEADASDGAFELPADGRGGAPPFEWALSRWTAALKEKQAKGVGYERRGVIKPDEAYVIAIDGGQLSQFAVSHGASHLPLALEAAFPIGPLAFRFENSGHLLGTENILRFSFKNHNGADIRTEPFLREEFANVSAVLGCWPPIFAGPELPVQVIHNPLAWVPVAPGTFGREAEEWHAVEVEDGGERFWQVERRV